MMSRTYGLILAAIVLAAWCTPRPCLAGSDYVLSFQERDKSESQSAKGGTPFLSVIVNGKTIYRKGMSKTGPLWHETARFSVKNPKDVRIALRLWGGGIPAHIGNIRVRTAEGGEVRLAGKWIAGKSRHEYITRFWDGGDIPYRMGMTLMPPARMSVGAKDWCEYRFVGALAEAPNLAVTRIFEYVGCFDDLNYYDDYKNISFSPPKPSPGKKVTISAKVRNCGSASVKDADVALLVDGKEVSRKTVSIPAASEKTIRFSWQASPGAHAFVVRCDPDGKIAETQEHDNMLLRMLFVGDARKAHPFLLFNKDETGKIVARAKKHPKSGGAYLSWLLGRTAKVTEREPLNALGAYWGGVSYLLSGDEKKRPGVVAVLKKAGDCATGRAFESGPGEMGQYAAYYALGYDCVASELSEADDREIREKIAKLLADGFKHTVTRVYGRATVPPKYPRPMPIQQYSQGSYLKLAGLSIAALALADYDGQHGNGERYLHFFLNAFHHEALHCMTSADGLYREGMGYMGMAENRTGNLFYNVFGHVGYNLFEAWPQARRTHLFYARGRMPNGWMPPENDNNVLSMTVRQCTYAHLLRDPEERSAVMWAWRNLPYDNRGGDFWRLLGGIEIPLYLIHQNRNEKEIPFHKPRWSPTQFMGDCLIFRGDWSKDSPYLYLGTKHWPTSSVSHDQTDQCQFMFYAKRAFLAIDPGYGQPFHRPVKAWCRGSKIAHNLLMVDGQRPRTRCDVSTSIYTYGDAYFPENAFTTSVFDFGESRLAQWEFKSEAGRTVIDHRRSVLFPRGTDYFVLIDDANPLTGGTHEYNFILHGSARRPYTGQKTPGDFVSRPAQAKIQDNLKLSAEGAAKVAEWRVNNTEGKEVRFRAVFASPAPKKLNMSAGDGWCGYVANWAARNRYLEAKTTGGRMRYLVVLFPDYVQDPSDDAHIQRLEGKAIKGGSAGAAAARIAHVKDKLVDYVATQDPGSKAPLSVDAGKLVTDAEIAFVRLHGGNCESAFLARGRKLSTGNKTVLQASKKANVLFADLSEAGKGKIELYISLRQATDISVAWKGAKAPAAVFIPGDCRPPALPGGEQRLSCRMSGGMVKFTGLTGQGRLILKAGR